MYFQYSKCFRKLYNAAWSFLGEPSSDQAVPTAAMCSVRGLRWQVSGHYKHMYCLSTLQTGPRETTALQHWWGYTSDKHQIWRPIRCKYKKYRGYLPFYRGKAISNRSLDTVLTSCITIQTHRQFVTTTRTKSPTSHSSRWIVHLNVAHTAARWVPRRIVWTVSAE